jgi:hypothetical protein
MLQEAKRHVIDGSGESRLRRRDAGKVAAAAAAEKGGGDSIHIIYTDLRQPRSTSTRTIHLFIHSTINYPGPCDFYVQAIS